MEPILCPFRLGSPNSRAGVQVAAFVNRLSLALASRSTE